LYQWTQEHYHDIGYFFLLTSALLVIQLLFTPFKETQKNTKDLTNEILLTPGAPEA
jgi:hypothetical protein